jgi:hypothetical protein
VILKDLLSTGELMLGLWQSTVLCEEMLEGEMCWTLQVEDDALEDNSFGRSIAEDFDGLIVCEVPLSEEEGDQALILRLGWNSGVSCCMCSETDIVSLQDGREIEG